MKDKKNDRYHAFLIFDNDSGNILYTEFLSELGKRIFSSTDPLVIGSFLSALSSFSEKMSFLGDVKTITYNELKFTFIMKENYVFVLLSNVTEPDADLLFKIKVIASIFVSEYLSDLTNVSTTSVVKTRNFSNFKHILIEVLSGTTRELPTRLVNALDLALRRILRQERYIDSMAILTFTGDSIIETSHKLKSKINYSKILSLLYLKNVINSTYIILKSRYLTIIVFKLASGILLLVRLKENTDPYTALDKLITSVIPELLHFFE